MRLLELLHDYLEGPGGSNSSSEVAAAGGETPAAGAAAAGEQAAAAGVGPSGVGSVNDNEGGADGCQPLCWQVPGHPPPAEFAATSPYELAAGSGAPTGAAPLLAVAQAVEHSSPYFAVGDATGPMQQLEQHWGEQQELAAGYMQGPAVDGSVWSSVPGCVPMAYPGGLTAFQALMAGAWEQQQQQLVGAYWGELPPPQPMAMAVPLAGMAFGDSLQAPAPVAPGMCENGWQAAGGPQLEMLPSPTVQPWWQEPGGGPQRTECAGAWAGGKAAKDRLNAASPACTLPSLSGGHRAAGGGDARGRAAGMQPAHHGALAAKQHMSGGGRAAAGERSPPSPALAAGAVPPPPPELLPRIEYDRRPRPVPVFKPYSHKDMLLNEYDVKQVDTSAAWAWLACGRAEGPACQPYAALQHWPAATALMHPSPSPASEPAPPRRPKATGSWAGWGPTTTTAPSGRPSGSAGSGRRSLGRLRGPSTSSRWGPPWALPCMGASEAQGAGRTVLHCAHHNLMPGVHQNVVGRGAGHARNAR